MRATTESLVELAPRLGANDDTVEDHLTELETRFAERESEILAFLPEEGRFDRLRREALELEERFPVRASRPPLFGVPIGVKDIFHVDGFITRAGCRLPEAEIQGSESAAVTALKHAGALILGKTVTTEFAYFAPGPTHNPHDLERTPGGSSSGSAAAVGAGLCPLSLGTQTIGSIGRPASFCGVVGFKPSYGRVSTDGVIPLAPSLDHVGFFTSDVAGTAFVAGTMLADWQETGSERLPVIGVPTGPYLERCQPPALASFERNLERLESGGLGVRRVHAMSDFQAIADRHRALVAAEAAAVHADWYARFPQHYRHKTVELLEQGAIVTETELDAALAGRGRLREQLDELRAEVGIDVWASPAATGAAPVGICATGDPIMNLPWTHAGVPTISLPAEPVDGLPMGLQLAGAMGDDEQLLGWALGVEEILRR